MMMTMMMMMTTMKKKKKKNLFPVSKYNIDNIDDDDDDDDDDDRNDTIMSRHTGIHQTFWLHCEVGPPLSIYTCDFSPVPPWAASGLVTALTPVFLPMY